MDPRTDDLGDGAPPHWLLTAFHDWLTAFRPELDAERATSTAGAMLQLKAFHLRSPSPGLWTREIITDLLTEVYPSRTVGREDERLLVVPHMEALFTFLQVQRLWDSASLRPAAARRLLSELEYTVIEAAEDPSRRSSSANVIHYGLSQGIDLEDPEQLQALMDWHNSLTSEERHELTDTGTLRRPPSRPFPTPGGGGGALAGSVPGADAYPWVLPRLRTGTLRSVGPAGEFLDRMDAQGQQSPLLRTMRALLQRLERGPLTLTDTGALRLKDCRAVLAEVGQDRPLRSMWDDPMLAYALRGLLVIGWASVSGQRLVRAGRLPDEPARWAQEAMSGTLYLWMTGGIFEGDRDIGADTIMALLVMFQEDGLVLPSLTQAWRERGGADGGPSEDIRRFLSVSDDLTQLHRMGVIDRRLVHTDADAEASTVPAVGVSSYHLPTEFRCSELVAGAVIMASDSAEENRR